jgi:hypothetical protein
MFMTFALQESERILETAIECTFPASDPIAVHSAFRAACEREATPPRRSAFGRAGDLMQEGLELRADAAQLLTVHLGELLQDAVALRAKP